MQKHNPTRNTGGRPRNLIPKLYKTSDGCGQVVINGRWKRLGKYGSPECEAAYQAIVAELLSGRNILDAASPDVLHQQITTRTVQDLGQAFIAHCDQYYKKNGKTTSHVARVRVAFDLLTKAGYGNQMLSSFGPVALGKLRDLMCRAKKRVVVRDAHGTPTATTQPMIKNGAPVSAYSRETINKYIWCIQQAFKWAVSQELIEETQYRSLLTLQTLRRGRTTELKLRESVDRLPVSDEHINATLPHLNHTIATMVRVQRLIGMRPLEVRIMRLCDLDRSSDDVWIYRVAEGKLAHLENIVREVPLGPRCIELLKPFIKGKKPSDYVFDARCHSNHKTLTSSSCPYHSRSYSVAIERACKRAGIPLWCPTQLRHALGTEVANETELDTARRILGHTTSTTTLRYVRRADTKAREFARKRA